MGRQHPGGGRPQEAVWLQSKVFHRQLLRFRLEWGAPQRQQLFKNPWWI